MVSYHSCWFNVFCKHNHACNFLITCYKTMKKSGIYGRLRETSKKSSSIGQGGRGRKVKIAMSSMNKNKKKSHKAYRGQGR